MVLLCIVLLIAAVVALVILGGLISVGVASGVLVLMFADVIVFGGIIYLIYKHCKKKKDKK